MDLEQIWADMKPGVVALPGNFLTSIAVVLVVTIIIRIIHLIIDRTLDNRIVQSERLSQSLRAKTLRSVLKSLVSYGLYIFALLYIITIFTGPLGLTLSSIIGVALGLGAQSFIKDIINGIFILMEDQYQIGELIRVNGFTGVVQNIGLRTTVIRDFSGEIHSIPNGNIQEITNSSRGNRRFMVDVTIAGSEHIQEAITILTEVAEEFGNGHEDLAEKPAFMGVVDNRDIGTTLRVQGRTDYAHQWAYQNELRKEILLRLEKAGIRTGFAPFPEEGMLK